LAHRNEIYLEQCIKAFCAIYLNDEYYALGIKLKNKLVSDGFIDFEDRGIKIWAATIIYSICYLNDLLPNHISSKTIHDFFGFSAVDVSNRAYAIINGIWHKYEYWANNEYINRSKENQGKYTNENDYSHQNNNSSKNERKHGYQSNYSDRKNKKINEKKYPNEYNNYCKLLGLTIDFTKSELKIKYRELMKTYHPDLIQNKTKEDKIFAEEKSKEINNAYEYLNNYNSR
jgi:hypothetical protein